ncbi:prohead protease/major capsid protein fusion protein [Methylobacterium sp. CCH5-D2]|uniref:prohead protease/major capsid protein fusion protein n=1 Tax=Methylobacterium sp. CCH5-D2 TaxID=1768765 RepID=UPI00082AEEA5|nr:prohead protease/major capsid protein fusion protein [Methylobacterium sp. CCH5-D2]
MTRSVPAPAGARTRSTPRIGPDGFEPGATATRAASFTPGTYDPVGRTIDAVFSSGARVKRWGGYEELAVSADAIDLGRAASGRMNFLFNHNQNRPIGVVEDARFEAGILVGRLRFADTDDGRSFEGQVARGELSSISVGYRVTTWTLTSIDDEVEVWRADKWELLEVSLVTVPADPQAAVRSVPAETLPTPQSTPHSEESDVLRRNSPQGTPPVETAPVVPVAPAAPVETRAAPSAPVAPVLDGQALVRAERERSATILDIGRRSGLPQDQIDAAIADGTTAEAFRNRGFEHMANRTGAVVTGQGTRAQIVGQGDDEKRGAAIENALLHRYDPRGVQLTDHAREFRGLTLLEIGSECLEARGVKTRGMGKHERAQAMLQMRSEASEIALRSGGGMTTSDFPNILANVANKTLRMGYQAAPQTFRPLVRVVTVPDFKPVSRVQLGEAPRLEKVNERGEFKRGKMGDAAEKYAVSTYGKIVAITRQVIINDDLDAFTRIPRSFGVAAANLESDLVWGEITGNPLMADGFALFSAEHANLGAGGGIGVDTVGTAREAMRNQTGLDGKTLLNVSPTYLVVPVALETKAEQFLGMIYPTKTADAVTDTMRKLKPISEPRLDAVSKTNFYVFGDPAQIDLIELAYLEGAEGLYTETRMGFDVDGVEVKVRQDVGAKVIDHRGAWRSQ